MIRRSEPISFIVPTYNSAGVVGDAVRSICQDNLQPGDEVILVDDGSSDDTVQILELLQRELDSMRIMRHRENKGTAAAARNTGIEAANHDLLFCLDSDNALEPASIGALYERLRTAQAEAAAFGEIHYFRADPAEITHKWVFTEEVTLADALAGVIWPGPSGNYLFTRGSWLRAGRYHEPNLENRSLDSWMFGIRQLGTGTRLVTLSGTWYFHRYGHESHYVRNWQRGNQSLAALIGLIPLLDLFVEEDVEYLFSKEGRYGWYDHLGDHPIRVKNHAAGTSGTVEQVPLPLEMRVRQVGASIVARIRRRLSPPGRL